MRGETLVQGIKDRKIASLARAISLVENGRDGYEELLSELHPLVGRSHRLGITGPPGAGKSTLIEELVQAYRDRGITVAVVAVDPTSPFTGGALLGDRIRMESLTLDPGVFIRSMASRGASGGLATTTREVCDVLDAYGFERIIIETVGVGQAELAIAASADTTVLVLVPESGDGVHLTAEVPGVSPQDLRVRVCDDEIRVEVVENGFTVRSSVYETPRIKPGQARMMFRNGVLEVKAPHARALF